MRWGVLANAQGTMNNLTFGNDTYQYYETICSGSPAGVMKLGPRVRRDVGGCIPT